MDEPSALVIAGKLLAVIALVLANGFFVTAEFSLVAVRRSRVEQLVEQGHPLARAVRRAVDNLDTFLAATQLGITMSSIGLGWIGEPALARIIEPLFYFLPGAWQFISAHALASAVAFAVITALHIVIGELAPKSLALQRTEGSALTTARPLAAFLFVFRPAITALNGLGNFAIRKFGLHPVADETLAHSVEELKLLMDSSREAGILAETEEKMVDSILRLRGQRVSALMTPRTEIVWLDLDHTPDENMRVIVESGFSRFPVAQGSLDNVLGVVKAKELLNRSLTEQTVDLKAAMRQPLFVPESMPALKVLDLFKRSRTHIALVVDEHGGLQGLLTLNDLMEAIVGEIPLAGEEAEPHAVQLDDGSWLLDGMMPIDEFKELFRIRELPGEEEDFYETLAGFVMMQLGEIPAEGLAFEWGGFRFEVAEMDGHRVEKVLARPGPGQGIYPDLTEEASGS